MTGVYYGLGSSCTGRKYGKRRVTNTNAGRPGTLSKPWWNDERCVKEIVWKEIYDVKETTVEDNISSRQVVLKHRPKYTGLCQKLNGLHFHFEAKNVTKYLDHSKWRCLSLSFPMKMKLKVLACRTLSSTDPPVTVIISNSS